MELIELILGELIEPSEGRNINANQNISGVDITKRFITTRANLEGTDLTNYKIVSPKNFAANFMHIGRDIKLPVAFNSTNGNIIVSPAYTVFRVKNENILDDYLFILMNSTEFDRLTWFYTDSSIRGNLDWSRFCSILLKLPPIPIQQKAVDAYNTINSNLTAYTDGLANLQLTCQAYIEKLVKEYPLEEIEGYIEPRMETNSNEVYALESVKGISIQKYFIETKANMEDVSLNKYLIVEHNDFAFNPNTARMGEKIPIALNQTQSPILVSSIYPTFRVQNESILIPEYLMLWFRRPEFDRYARFHSWGSAREVFTFADLCKVKIPIPPKSIQQSIVDIYHAQCERQKIAVSLNKTLREICPVLISQSLEQVF